MLQKILKFSKKQLDWQTYKIDSPQKELIDYSSSNSMQTHKCT